MYLGKLTLFTWKIMLFIKQVEGYVMELAEVRGNHKNKVTNPLVV